MSIQQEILIPAFYGRVSSEDQAERGTIQNQIEFKYKFCDLHQYPETTDYIDDGISGTVPLIERPGGRRLFEDAKAGKFNLLLLYKLDRLGRSAWVIIDAVRELEKYGVKIKSMTEVFDTTEPAGRFVLNMLASVADLERSNILERMRIGAERAARAGKYLGGIVAYGYRVEHGYLILDDRENIPGFNLSPTDVMRLMYELCAVYKYSTIKISEYFNAVGYPPLYVRENRKLKKGERTEKTSGRWTPGRIRNMLVNPIYKGVASYGKRSQNPREIISYQVPQTVSGEVWDKAQKVLRENQLEAMKNNKHNYLLRGLIKCDFCGLTYIGTYFSSSTGLKKRWYRCNGKQQRYLHIDKHCNAKNIHAEWIEEIVWEDCLYYINHPDKTIKELAASLEKNTVETKPVQEEIDQLKKAVLEKEEEKQKILDLFRRKIIDMNDVEPQLQKISNEKDALKERLAQLESIVNSNEMAKQQIASVEEQLTTFQTVVRSPDILSFEQKREIVKQMVKEVKVESIEAGTQVRIFYYFTIAIPRTDRDSSKRLT
jgi:site-specific DNA recombinase